MSFARVLVVGATGLLGPYLLDAARDLAGPAGVVLGAARTGADLDLDACDPQAVARLLDGLRPDLVIHAAGLTDVDACEADPARAMAVNADAAGHLARALDPAARLVYVSTDQVYPDLPGPHREDAAAPVNAYGRSKLAGEAQALAHPRALVLRTNLFGPSRTPGRKSLSDFVVESLAAGRAVTLFTDIFFSPLHMADLGRFLALAARRGLGGVYNLGCREGASKRDFALAVAARKGLSTATATAGSGASLPGRARRPRDMRLDVSRLEAALGVTLPTLSQEVEKL